MINDVRNRATTNFKVIDISFVFYLQGCIDTTFLCTEYLRIYNRNNSFTSFNDLYLQEVAKQS